MVSDWNNVITFYHPNKLSQRQTIMNAPRPSGGADDRLAAVEQSMADLTGAVREELSTLRKALLNQKDSDDDQT